jgi:hypothetical protein
MRRDAVMERLAWTNIIDFWADTIISFLFLVTRSPHSSRLGNNAFSQQDFKTAIEHYTKAIQLEPSNHIFFSNRR